MHGKLTWILLAVAIAAVMAANFYVLLRIVKAQGASQAGTSISNGSGVPSLPCVSGSVYFDYTNGALWIGSGSPCAWGLRSPLQGTTTAMGGSLLLAGTCESTTATVPGAQVGFPANWATSDGSDRIGLGLNVAAYVSAANTATVEECAILAATPPSKTFNVKVFPFQ